MGPSWALPNHPRSRTMRARRARKLAFWIGGPKSGGALTWICVKMFCNCAMAFAPPSSRSAPYRKAEPPVPPFGPTPRPEGPADDDAHRAPEAGAEREEEAEAV